ncbi:hypothetical protein [Tolypothrix sp. PCC 7601]|uniref:hypothetical protein n=1 Tax=Tolypothrix sp. PCC 7601 TaxID=1188 RepID=UPI00295BCBED|nr:hypothetical protein [Tolypothrix sp. PCC 7601]
MNLQDIIKLDKSLEFDYLRQDQELAKQVQIRLLEVKEVPNLSVQISAKLPQCGIELIKKI